MIMFLILMNKNQNNLKTNIALFKCLKLYMVINIFQMCWKINVIIKKYAGKIVLMQIHEEKVQMWFKNISTALWSFIVEDWWKKLSFLNINFSSKFGLNKR